MLSIFFSIFSLFVNHKLKFIINSVTLYLGKISFTLYLIHQNISINYIIPYCMNKLYMSFWVASICVALPIALLLASIITFYIEVPFGRIMKANLRQKFAYKPTPVLNEIQSSSFIRRHSCQSSTPRLKFYYQDVNLLIKIKTGKTPFLRVKTSLRDVKKLSRFS